MYIRIFVTEYFSMPRVLVLVLETLTGTYVTTYIRSYIILILYSYMIDMTKSLILHAIIYRTCLLCRIKNASANEIILCIGGKF